MARTHRSVERKEKSDLEYYKGLIRQLKKKISSLEKENARLNKILRLILSASCLNILFKQLRERKR